MNNKTIKEKKTDVNGTENIESIKNPKGSLFQKFSGDVGNVLVNNNNNNNTNNNNNNNVNKKVIKNTEAITKAF